MATSSTTSAIVFRRSSTIIFFTASMFTSVVDVLGQPGQALDSFCIKAGIALPRPGNRHGLVSSESVY